MALRRTRVRPIRSAVYATLIVAALWLAGLIWYAGEIARATANPDAVAAAPAVDAIVVLTGTPDRLGVGFELMGDGRARRMFISGVYRGVDVQQILRAIRRSPNEAEASVQLGYGADDTVGNARETAGWMAKEGLTSLILVTSNFHMPRALLEFHAAMPEVVIVPHATAAPSFKIDAWWRWPGTIRLIASEWSKYIAARARLALGLRTTWLPSVSPAPMPPPTAQESTAREPPTPEPAMQETPAPEPTAQEIPAPSSASKPETTP